MKTAVITGGTRGIGAGLVHAFLRKGWNVAYSGTSDDTIERSLERLTREFSRESFAVFRCDVRDEVGLACLWESAFRMFGRIDIWVNNAGIAYDQVPFHRMPPEVIRDIIDTNVKGLMLATQTVYNRMIEQGSGAIYNMEGLGSDGRMIAGITPYGTSKRAVNYFSRAFAKEVRGGAVIVGILNPGMVLTDLLLEPLKKNPPNTNEIKRIYNILASEPEEVTEYLVYKMIANRKNGATIKYLTTPKALWRFFSATVTGRDIVSRYL